MSANKTLESFCQNLLLDELPLDILLDIPAHELSEEDKDKLVNEMRERRTAQSAQVRLRVQADKIAGRPRKANKADETFNRLMEGLS